MVVPAEAHVLPGDVVVGVFLGHPGGPMERQTTVHVTSLVHLTELLPGLGRPLSLQLHTPDGDAFIS